MKLLRWMVALLLAVFALPTTADVLRCDGQIIEEGDSRVRVLEHCGEPEYEDGARWYYRKAANVMTVLHFEADKVSFIEDERD